jgi:hypothetical protein
LKLEVATLKIILDGAMAITTLGTRKWYGSITTYENLAKITSKRFWAPKHLDLLVALIS